MSDIMSFALKLLERALEKLKLKKPTITPVTASDEVWLFDNVAHVDPKNDTWAAEFVAAYFQRDGGEDIAEWVGTISRELGIADDEVARGRIAERIEPFINVIRSGKTVDIKFGKGGLTGNYTLGPSLDRGVSFNTLRLPGGKDAHKDGEIAETHAVMPGGVNKMNSMKTVFADPEGWGVISDIDDTIKISEVRNRIALLRHTFVEEFKAVKGMPELYHQLAALMNPIFFYLSASPYNLQPFIRAFLDAHFPQGQLVLRDMSWMELESFIVSLTVGTEGFKVARMDKMHSWFPHRKMIAIGDSTQKDPEAYATIYKKYPGWIKAIYIRVVEGVDKVQEKSLNSNERFEKAFKGIPKEAWHLFRSAEEVTPWVQNVVLTAV